MSEQEHHPCAVSASTDGFSPCLWGPPLWHVLYMTAFNYPERHVAPERCRGYRTFLYSLACVLPCAACRRHYRANMCTMLSEHPDALKTRANLVQFVHELHRRVALYTRRQHGSSTVVPSIEEVVSTYEALRVQGDHVPPFRTVLRVVPFQSPEATFFFEAPK